MPAASAWSPRSTASRAARWCEAGIDALKAVWHRGAVDADGKTGDGAGIHVEIPQDFFAEAVQRSGHTLTPGADRAWARCSCRKTDLGAQERCRQIVETEILRFGYQIYGWRQVPVNVDVHRREGQRHAARDRADHDLERRSGTDDAAFERDLYVIRRRIEKQAIAAQIPELLHLLAVLPLDHLQGHVPGRAA